MVISFVAFYTHIGAKKASLYIGSFVLLKCSLFWSLIGVFWKEVKDVSKNAFFEVYLTYTSSSSNVIFSFYDHSFSMSFQGFEDFIQLLSSFAWTRAVLARKPL